MSLDVSLRGLNVLSTSRPRRAIYSRVAGEIKEISREEWDARYPDREPHTVEVDEGTTVFTANITHNLIPMARAAGLFDVLWHPEESSIEHARQLMEPLREGLARLVASPETYRVWNSPNGWGTYETLVAFVTTYLSACEAYPEAKVEVSR